MNFSQISFKEYFMLALGLMLVYGLYYLRTQDQLFVTQQPPLDALANVTAEVEPQDPPDNADNKTLPLAVLETVQIPDWLDSKNDYDLQNFTAENLLDLAQISHQQDHDFFPDNQNTLVYLLKARELGVEGPELNQLMTAVHANLYEQAELAIEEYDVKQLTAFTARLKSIDENDTKISAYTNQISIIQTLKRLTQEIEQYVKNDVIYQPDQKDAVHTLKKAMAVDEFYVPLIEIKETLLKNIQDKALVAARELDFSIADTQVSIMQELDAENTITLNTLNDLTTQKQNRYTYLDRQFYNAIDNLNLPRAEEMIEALSELEIANSQLNGYRSLFEKTQMYGPFEISEEFNDVLDAGIIGPTMVVIPTGQFEMGSQKGPKHQRPQHNVSINYGFAVAKNETTVAQFKQFIDSTDYVTTAEKNNRTKVYDASTGRFKDKFNINWKHDFLGKVAAPEFPVIHVSWDDANAYVNWLSYNTGKNYRLLSESEFEYLLSANSDSIYPWGNNEPTQIWGNFSGAKDRLKKSRIKWREGFSEYEDGHWGPAPVGSFIQSLQGINDLSGNVMEWVDDCWHDSYTRAPRDGSAWINPGCEERVIRGGNWASANTEYQSSHRLKANANLTDPRIGFRVAISFEY